MSIKESMMNLWGKVRQGPVIRDEQESNLRYGGHTGYQIPVQPKHAQPKRQEQAAPAPQVNYDPNFYQKTGFQQDYHGNDIAGGASWQGTGTAQTVPNGTGFTGFNGMPAGFGQPQQGFGQTAQQMPGGYGQAQPQTGFGQTAQQMPGGYGQVQPQGGFGQTAQQGFMQGNPQAAVQGQQPEQPYPTEGNVTYAFPQQFRENGVAYTHVERLAQPLSVATCFRLIEFMRNGESIIVNLELAPDENERTRCLDLLCGAAFTMQCSFTRVASRCIYLIAPHNVNVQPYESIRQLSEQDSANRWTRQEGVRTDLRWNERRGARQNGYAESEDRRYGFSR